MMKLPFKTEIWVAFKILKSGRKTLGISALFSLIGVVLGVASLVVAMAVMSGFEKALSQSLIDVTGDLRVFPRTTSSIQEPSEELIKKIQLEDSRVIDGARYAVIEAVAANQGRLSGVVIQGVEENKYERVLRLGGRVREGKLDIKNASEPDWIPAMVGRGLLKTLNLKVGDTFKVVVPIANEINPSRFSRKLATLQVTASLDLGKHEFDERWIVIGLAATQNLAGLGDGYTGLILKTENSQDAREMRDKLNQILSPDYGVKDWRQTHENLLGAAQIEKYVIFCVLLVILVAAAFNVSSTLSINVVKKYSSISLLKAVGATPGFILRVFSLQGILMGFVGLIFGILLGLLLCAAFIFLQTQFSLLPGDIYRIEGFGADLRFWDLFSISLATLVVCFVSTLAPAIRGAKLLPVEGLRYE